MLDDRHRLSFGCSALAGLYHPISAAGAEQVLDAAWSQGIRYFDTAPHYGHGMSERRLGDFLRDKTDWVLSSKVGRVLTPDSSIGPIASGFHNALPFRQHFDFSYDGIMRSVEGSFDRLGLSKIDILYVHDLGDPGAGTDTQEYREQFLTSGHKALEDLKQAGTIKSVGLGVNTTQICEELVGRVDLDLILLAGRYTLLDRSAQDRLLPMCETHGVRLVIGGVFNSGILATGAVPGAHYDYAPAGHDILQRVQKIEDICDRFDVPLGSAALQFPARHPLVASTLIGTSKVASLTRNIKAWGQSIPEPLWAALDEELDQLEGAT